MKYCILQPGQLGDIIICLPIAKKLFDQGHEVFWPIWEDLYNNFTKGHIDYVKFNSVPKTENWYSESLQVCKNNNIIPVDVSFTQLGTWNTENTKKFRSQNELSFDAFKYKLANVDFSEKWNLSITRNLEREEDLFSKLVKHPEYATIHQVGTEFKRNIQFNNPKSIDIIEIKPFTDCIFDWIKILENSKYIIMIDSVFANLTEQLNIQNKKYFVKLQEFRLTPVFKNNWIEI